MSRATPLSPGAGFGVWAQLGTLVRLTPRQFGRLLFDAYSAWSADDAARLGAALAYYALFSIAPVIIIITGVVGLVLGQAAASGQVAPWLERFAGAESARAAEVMLSYSSSRSGSVTAAVVGGVSLFVAASTLVNELRRSLNILWKVTPAAAADAGVLASVRGMLLERLYAVAIVLGAGLLIVSSIVVNAVVSAMSRYAAEWLPVPALALQGVNLLVGVVVMVVTFTLLYKVVPDARMAWGDAVVGALLTTVLFQLGTVLMAMFLGRAAGSVFGSAASVLALLVWVYYSAQVFFFGAEAARLFAERFGGGIRAPHRSGSVVVTPHAI